MIKKIFASTLIFFTITTSLFSIEPDVFVQSTVNRASKLLSDNISKEEKIKQLKLIAKDTVDIRGIGFYTLGSTRKTLSDEQKFKYSELFEEYFLKSFSSRLAEYTNPEINVNGKEKLNEKYTIVNSVLKAFKTLLTIVYFSLSFSLPLTFISGLVYSANLLEKLFKKYSSNNSEYLNFCSSLSVLRVEPKV